MMLERIFDIIDFQIKRHPSQEALSIKIDNVWVRYSSQEIKTKILQTAQGLLNWGFKKNDTIVIIPQAATPNTLFLDLAAQMIGLLPIIAYSTFTKEQINHIVKEASPKVVFYANDRLKARLDSNEVEAYSISESTNSEYQQRFVQDNFDQDAIVSISDQITSQDLAMVIYTSGSTGLPKGVMLSHLNIMSNLSALMSLLPVGPGAKTITFLPISHILERASVYMSLSMGFRIHTLEDINKLQETMAEVRPAFMSAVPRIIEKMLESLASYRSEKGFFTQKLLKWAIEVGLEYEPHKGFKPHYAFNNIIARYLVLSKLRKATGGKLKGIVVGGAHLRPDLANLLEVAGIKIREGYGMTETSPIITINRFEPGMHKIGTVGLPISNVQIKLDQKEGDLGGEILVKGPNVTTGYYKHLELSQDLFDAEGWLKTGDIGTIDEKGFLTITDRKKNIFKTSAGKYVAPQLLENLFQTSRYLSQILIIGFHKPYITALIVPNYLALKKWAGDNDIHWTSPTYMAHNIMVREKIQEDLENVNKTLPNFERIIKFTLLDSEWTVENDLLSASLKPRRKEIEARFKKQIEEMYKEQMI